MIRAIFFITLFSCSSFVFALETKNGKTDASHTADHPPHDHPSHDHLKKLDEGISRGRKRRA